MMRSIRIQPTPYAQMATAALVLRPNYAACRVRITVEGIEHIPLEGKVILALNHTDRYNYWPLQYKLWRENVCFTATWVKGKYYNSAAMAKFMRATNNIPTPSRGYILTADAHHCLGAPPSDALYRLLRTTLDDPERDEAAAKAQAKALGVAPEYTRLTTTARTLCGLEFNPARQSYFDTVERLFGLMMAEFTRLNDEAFALGHKIIVFPEGTRSLTLTTGRPGLAQMALHTGATVVPVGCNGSDQVYPGNSPLARQGHITYRIGQPLTPQGELSPFQIDAPYVPFTPAAEAAHGKAFQGMTKLVMSRIKDLLDPRYLPDASTSESAVAGTDRFL